jgi:hypothetical protein
MQTMTEKSAQENETIESDILCGDCWIIYNDPRCRCSAAQMPDD